MQTSFSDANILDIFSRGSLLSGHTVCTYLRERKKKADKEGEKKISILPPAPWLLVLKKENLWITYSGDIITSNDFICKLHT